MKEIKKCKHNKCESCRNKKIDEAKKILKVVGQVGSVVTPVVVGMLMNKTKKKKK